MFSGLSDPISEKNLTSLAFCVYHPLAQTLDPMNTIRRTCPAKWGKILFILVVYATAAQRIDAQVTLNESVIKDGKSACVLKTLH
jgi:hypothetical protein